MKKIGILGFILFGIFFYSCDDGSGNNPGTKTQYYYYEYFTITKTNYNSVPFPSIGTFTVVKNYRNSLRNYMVEFVGSGTDATQQEIYDLITQRGMTSTEANAEISFLNSVGNNVFIFEHVTNTTLYVILYVEK